MKDIFCKIVQRNEPAYIIAETDDMFAILDIEPATKGHTLIISKRHVLEISDLTKSEKEQHEHLVKLLIHALKSVFGYTTVTSFTSNADQQDIPHLHTHVHGEYSESNRTPFYQTFLDKKHKISQLKESAEALQSFL